MTLKSGAGVYHGGLGGSRLTMSLYAINLTSTILVFNVYAINVMKKHLHISDRGRNNNSNRLLNSGGKPDNHFV